jgi:hypothetical protein
MQDALWYYAQGGTQQGPVSAAVLKNLLASGQLPTETLIWREGMANWQAATAVAELSNQSVGVAPPPLPPGARTVPYASPVQSFPGQSAKDIGQDAGMRMLLPVGRSGWAIASGYLGLFSFFPCIGVVTGIAAVITGLVALRDIKQNPQRHGLGRAWFGIIAGILFTIVWAIAGVAYFANQTRYPGRRF